MWRFGIEETHLWRQVLVAKYGVERGGPPIGLGVLMDVVFGRTSVWVGMAFLLILVLMLV